LTVFNLSILEYCDSGSVKFTQHLPTENGGETQVDLLNADENSKFFGFKKSLIFVKLALAELNKSSCFFLQFRLFSALIIVGCFRQLN
jgi:hypothetical protein